MREIQISGGSLYSDSILQLPLRGQGSANFTQLKTYCRNLIKKPWAFIRVPYMNPTILGLRNPGSLLGLLIWILLFWDYGLRVS